MLRTLPPLAALAIVTASGAVHGTWTGRWAPSAVVAARVTALKRVPGTVGGWRGRDMPLDRRTVERGGIDGYLMRSYEDREGHVLTVLLVCGRPGPVSVHTPEVCYAGTGYEPSSERTRLALGGGPGPPADTLWVTDFTRPGPALEERLRIFYGWTGGGPWAAPENPRLSFAGLPAIYKLYVVREVTGAEVPAADDPAAGFLREFLPTLHRALIAPP